MSPLVVMSPLKEDSKAGDATITVNIDEFTRTRDSVIISLAQLQSAVSDLSRAYINHTNTVLNPGSAGIDTGITSGITSVLLENGLLGRLASPGVNPEIGDKKRKKRRAHDPNAPKRALTPYFLFMKSNRARIAEELGSSATAGEVNDEGLKRWHNMPADEKEHWRSIYQDNLATYRKKMEAYKAGLPVPEDENEDKTASPPQQATAAHESEDVSSSSEEEEEEKESSPEPVKEPTPPPPSRKRRRSEAKTPKQAPSPVLTRKESPEKKKRDTAAKEKEAPKEKEKPKPKEPEVGTPARKGANSERRTRKKRKSEATEA